jgi:GT2 family glycosyltransferase
MTIIVLSKFNDIFQDCLTSINKFAPEEKKILVRDGEDIAPPAGWTVLQGTEPFVYSRNANIGISACTGDVLLMNDDCTFVNGGTVERLEAVMACNPDIGILSPRIDGGVGNSNQNNVATTVLYTQQRLAFVCVLVRRSVIDEIGLLDERFTGYGWDDDDYCRRALDAGWKLACTADAIVKHGHGKEKWSSSFLRTKGWADNQAIYKKKWDAEIRTTARFVPSGPYAYDKTGLVTDWWSRHRR